MMLWPLIAISPIASGVHSISSQLSGSISFISTPGTGMPIEPTRDGLAQRREARHRGGLGQPVALEDRHPELLLELLVHLDRERRAAGDGDPQVAP